MSVFKFDYKPESELSSKQAPALLMPGFASFKVVACFDKKKDGSPLTTMGGAPKITLSLSVKDSVGCSSLVYDDLTANTAWKIKELLDALGLAGLYDSSGQLNPDDLIGGNGKCRIKLQKSDNYPDKMAIEKYIKADKQQTVFKPDYAAYDESLPF